jgi:hypothetical protein
MLATAHMSIWVARGLLLALGVSCIAGLRLLGSGLKRAGARMERSRRGDAATSLDKDRPHQPAEQPNPFGDAS